MIPFVSILLCVVSVAAVALAFEFQARMVAAEAMLAEYRKTLYACDRVGYPARRQPPTAPEHRTFDPSVIRAAETRAAQIRQIKEL